MSFDASIAFAALVEYFVVDVLAKAADQKRGPGKLEDYDLKRTLTTDDFLHRKFGTGVVCVRGKKRSRPSSPSSSKKSEEKDDEKNAAAATIVSEDETKRKRTKESAKRTSEATSGEKIVKEGASKTTVAAA